MALQHKSNANMLSVWINSIKCLVLLKSSEREFHQPVALSSELQYLYTLCSKKTYPTFSTVTWKTIIWFW